MNNRGSIRRSARQSAVAAAPPGSPNHKPGWQKSRIEGDPAASTVPQSRRPNRQTDGPPQPPPAAPPRVPSPRPEPTLGATALDRFDMHDTDAEGFNWR